MLTQSELSKLHQNDSDVLHSVLNPIPKEVAYFITNTSQKIPFEFFLNALHTNAAILDMSGMVVATNPAWKRFNKMGRDAICVVGQNYFQYRLKTSGQHPILSEQFSQGLERIFAGYAESFLLELPFMSAKKSSHISIQAKQMLFEDQSFILVQFEDKLRQISVRNQAAKYQKDLEMLLENLPDIIARFDHQYRYLYITPSYELWSGLCKDQLLGHTFAEVGVSIRLVDIWQKAIDDVFQCGLPQTIEYEMRYHGKKCYFESRLIPEFNETELVQSVLTCTREITQNKYAQTMLEARERRFRALIEHSAEAIALFDATGKILYCSPSTSHILGFSLDEFIGYDSTEFIHPDDVATARLAFRLSLSQPRIGVPTEVRFCCQDGSWRWIAGTFTNLLDDPDVEAIIANYRDVSTNHQQAELIQKREQQYRTLIENLPNALVAQIDLEMRFSIVGGTLLKSWSKDNQDLEKATLEEYIADKYLEPATALYQRAFLGEQIEEKFQYNDKMVKISVIPNFDLHQNIIGATTLLFDVTDIYEAQTALSASEVRFQAAFDQADIGMAVLDMNGDWRRVNNAFAVMLGYSPQELQKLPISAISHPNEYHNDIERGVRLLEEGQLQYEKCFKHANGSTVWARVHLAVVNDGKNQYMFKQIGNITEEKKRESQIQQLNLELEQRLERMNALREIDSALVSSLDLSLTLNLVIEQIRKQLDAQSAAILLYYPESLSLRYFVGRGFKTQTVKAFSVRLGYPLGGLVGLDRLAMVVPNIAARDIPFEYQDFLQAEGVNSYIGLPLLAKGELLGVIEIYNGLPLEPSAEMMEYLGILAGQAALAIENTRVLRALQYSNTELAMAYDETIEGWSRALDLRDKETEGHSRRVTEMTVRLAREMNLPESEIIHMRRGALLHDIGKMGVPDEILLKPGKLTDEEWVMMRKHPDFAHELLAPIGFLGQALDIPYAHHEKWDGTGYPRGLRGQRIPLSARIFAIVDVWDALKSDRPYRKGWSSRRIIDHILESSGTHFDPKVVEAFLKLLAKEEDVFLSDLVDYSAMSH